MDFFLLALALAVLGVWTAFRARHEQQHCHQIGQIQHVVAELGAHLRGMTAARLPDDLEQFVDEIRRHEASDGRD